MAIVTVLVVACVTFFLMNAIPGNPWLSEKTPTQATIDALNAKYGLDQPLIVQLGKYLGNLLHGDFGTSIGIFCPQHHFTLLFYNETEKYSSTKIGQRQLWHRL